jgi:hypothetical protein
MKPCVAYSAKLKCVSLKPVLRSRVGTSCTKDPLDEGVLLLTGEGTTVHRLNGTGKSAVNRVDN